MSKISTPKLALSDTNDDGPSGKCISFQRWLFRVSIRIFFFGRSTLATSTFPSMFRWQWLECAPKRQVQSPGLSKEFHLCTLPDNEHSILKMVLYGQAYFSGAMYMYLGRVIPIKYMQPPSCMTVSIICIYIDPYTMTNAKKVSLHITVTFHRKLTVEIENGWPDLWSILIGGCQGYILSSYRNLMWNQGAQDRDCPGMDLLVDRKRVCIQLEMVPFHFWSQWSLRIHQILFINHS